VVNLGAAHALTLTDGFDRWLGLTSLSKETERERREGKESRREGKESHVLNRYIDEYVCVVGRWGGVGWCGVR
jgi:hypothetical protein